MKRKILASILALCLVLEAPMSSVVVSAAKGTDIIEDTQPEEQADKEQQANVKMDSVSQNLIKKSVWGNLEPADKVTYYAIDGEDSIKVLSEETGTGDGDEVIGDITDSVKVVINGESTKYDTLSEALEAVGSSTATVMLLKDITYRGSLTISGKTTLSLNGNTLQIKNGNLNTANGIDLAGGTLQIDGQYNQSYGTLVLNGGKMYTKGLYLCSATQTAASKSTMTMSTDEDYVEVDGDVFIYTDNGTHVLSAGVLKVTGDITCKSKFVASDTHKTIMAGTNQSLSLKEGYFSRFELAEGHSGEITVGGTIGFAKLLSDVEIINEDTITLKNVGLNGHNLTVSGAADITYGIDLEGGNLTIGGDVTASRTSTASSAREGITLHGGTMSVNGVLHQTYGTLNISGGKLYTKGLFLCDADRTDSYSVICMTDEKDYVEVDGNLFINSTITGSWSNALTEGVLKVSGDITCKHCVSATDNHKLILTGEGNQKISMTNDYFNQFELAEGHSGKLIVENGIGFTKLLSDLELINEDVITLKNMALNGHNMTVSGPVDITYGIDLEGGNLTIGGDVTASRTSTASSAREGITLHGGTMTVNGVLHQTYGTLNISGGKLYTKGLLLCDADKTDSYSNIYMNDANDYVEVDGDFLLNTTYTYAWYSQLTEGTLKISGNVICKSRFGASGNHKLILNGTGEPAVSMTGESYFNIVQLAEGHSGKVKASGVIGISKLLSDVELINEETITLSRLGLNGHNVNITNAANTTGNILLQGGNLTINGDVVADSGSSEYGIDLAGGTMTVNGVLHQVYGTINVNGGKLITKGLTLASATNGEAYSRINMTNEKDVVEVDGDVMIYTDSSWTNTLSAGDFSLSGSFTQKGKKNNFDCKGTHRLIINGANGTTQNITFESPSAKFNVIFIPCNNGSDFELSPNNCYNRLINNHEYQANYVLNTERTEATASVKCAVCGKDFNNIRFTFIFNGYKVPAEVENLDIISASIEESDFMALDAPGEWQGYGFYGWYTEADYEEGELVSQVPTTEAGNYTLYARWVEFSLDQYETTLIEQKSTKLTLTTSADSPIIWTSSDETVATVTQNGIVEAVGYGVADITATTVYEEKALMATCTVTVTPAPVFSVTYQLDGGVNSEENIHSFSELTSAEDLILREATKEGCIFAGWYNQDGIRVYEIDSSMQENLTLFAKWIENNKGLWIDEIRTYSYTGKAIQPVITVYYGTTRLTEGTDYTVSYKNNVKACGTDTADNKKPLVTVKGKGNYAGTAQRNFAIEQADISNADVADLYVAFTAGKLYTPSPVVVNNGKKLAKNKDYTLDVKDVFGKAGRYTCTIYGKGNFKGEKTYNFMLADASKMTSIGKAVVKLNSPIIPGGEITRDMISVRIGTTELKMGKDFVIEDNYFENAGKYAVTIKAPITSTKYYGYKKFNVTVKGTSIRKSNADIEPVCYTGYALEPYVSINCGGQELNLGEDYVVISYANNINAGKGKVTVKGIGEYEGTKVFTFPITKAKASDITIEFANGSYEQPYQKGGAKPEIIVWNNDMIMDSKTYSVKYSGNNAISVGIVTVSSKNIEGKATETFTIEEQSLENLTFAYCPDVEEGKKPSPVIFDTNGKQLKMGTDFVYDPDTMEATGIKCYEGTIVLPYDTVDKEYNLSRAKISVKKGNKISYTGSEITEEDLSEKLVVSLNGVELVYGEDFEILIIPGNPLRGKVGIYVKGLGEYGGMKAFKLNVVPRTILE